MIQLGTKIKTLRIKNNLTQAQLGGLLNVTSAMISAYETDKRMPSYHTLIKLTKIFHVTSDYLLGIEKEASLEEHISLQSLNREQQYILHYLEQTFRKK